MYHYYERNLDILPKARDGNLDYGLLRCMMSLDLYKQDGDSYKKSHGIVDKTNDDNDEGRVEF
jgi:hypothetical protein